MNALIILLLLPLLVTPIMATAQRGQPNPGLALQSADAGETENSTGTPLSNVPLNHFVSQSQAQVDQAYIDCWHNKDCKAHIDQKFTSANVPDCDTTGDIGICWDHMRNQVHQ